MQQSFCNWLSKRKYSESDLKRRESIKTDSANVSEYASSENSKLEYYDITNSSIENMQAVVTQSRHSSITSLVSSRNGSISVHSGGNFSVNGRISTGNNDGWQEMSGSFKSSKNEIRNSGNLVNSGNVVNSGNLERGNLERLS